MFGTKRHTVVASGTRSLSLVEVRETPKAKAGAIAKLRDSHHRIARLAAIGLSNYEIADKAGFTAQRVSVLRNQRSMQDLIAHYRREVDEEFRKEVGGYYENAVKARDIAMRQLLDQLEEADDTGELLPPRQLAAINADLADRTGYGKRSTQVNVNVDFAAQLDRAIARSREVGAVPQLKVVQSVPTSLDPVVVEQSPQPLKRRI